MKRCLFLEWFDYQSLVDYHNLLIETNDPYKHLPAVANEFKRRASGGVQRTLPAEPTANKRNWVNRSHVVRKMMQFNCANCGQTVTEKRCHIQHNSICLECTEAKRAEYARAKYQKRK